MFNSVIKYGQSLPETVTIPNPSRTSRSFMFNLEENFDVDVIATFSWSHSGNVQHMVPLVDSTGSEIKVTIPSSTGRAGIMLSDLVAPFIHVTFAHEAGTAKPVISAESEDNITAAEADIEATVNPGGSATSVIIEYGLTTTYGKTVEADESPLAAGTSGTTASVTLEELTPETIYHYRIVATNSLGTTTGTDQSFETLAE